MGGRQNRTRNRLGKIKVYIKMYRAINTDDVAEPNAFAVQAALPKLHLVDPEAIYLLWIACRELSGNASEPVRFLYTIRA
ncbi:MAG: hypothetical protein Q4D16_25750 [Eubacteriales bacterium]|nr:hypothetical protein [Eubacteriales bacterium]